MPRWRPRGTTSRELFAQDGNECVLRVVGRCLIPNAVTIIGGRTDDGTIVDGNVPNALSLDHILEQAHFGADHRPENLLTMHRYCNTMRGPRPFVRWVGRENAIRLAQECPRIATTIRRCIGGYG